MGSEYIKITLNFACTLCYGALLRESWSGWNLGRFFVYHTIFVVPRVAPKHGIVEALPLHVAIGFPAFGCVCTRDGG